MRALTLIQPWAWAIAYAGKDLENRSWKPPANLSPTETIAIHAGKGWDREAFAWLRTNALRLGIPMCPPRGQHQHGRIVAVCRVAGYFLEPNVKRPGEPPNPWFNPPPDGCAWHLTNIARLPDPVECRGALGLFEIPDGVEGSIALSLERRRACSSCSRAREQRHGPPSCEIRDDPTLHDAGGCAGWRPL